ncbi:MAG: hypothetical protein QOG44_1825, partial [Acidimicrobiaceae bacterium]|nr:hypothetical protein [Acidimicrobiaceae bacterium]
GPHARLGFSIRAVDTIDADIGEQRVGFLGQMGEETRRHGLRLAAQLGHAERQLGRVSPIASGEVSTT